MAQLWFFQPINEQVWTVQEASQRSRSQRGNRALWVKVKMLEAKKGGFSLFEDMEIGLTLWRGLFHLEK